MRVLITGGYGFIGSYVASRFYKEGAEIFIIDNLSCKYPKDADYKHKFYKLDIADKKCEEVFKAGKFDYVIHCAAQKDEEISRVSPYMDTYTNILGLINMLDLSHKYGVKKFVFISSASIYGNSNYIPTEEKAACNPLTTNAISKYSGEVYLHKWKEIYGLKYVCLRVSNVYGYGGTGVISSFMERIIKGQDLVVFGDGNQTRDFIYVEDVVEAIYSITKADLYGIYNLSANTETSINDLIASLRKITKINNILFKDKQKTDIKRVWLDNNKLMYDLSWSPLYTLEDGLERTFNLYRNEDFKVRNIVKRKSTNEFVKIFMLVWPYLNNLLGFVCVLSSYIIFDALKNMQIVGIGLFYIVLIGIIYGLKSSIISSGLTIVAYVVSADFLGKDPNLLIMSSSTIITFLLFIFTGYVSGYAFEKYRREIEEREDKIKELEDKHGFLNDMFFETLAVKEKYEEQILSSEDSFNKIFNIVMQLENLEPEAIYNSAIVVLESVLKNENIIIHAISDNEKFARIVAHSKKVDIDGARSIKLDENFEFKMVTKSGKPYVNVELKEDRPSFIGPVIDRSKVIAIISVYHVEFEKMNNNYTNLFEMLIKLVSHAFSRAYMFEEAMRNENYVKDSFILKRERFKAILGRKIEAFNKFGTPYTLVKINVEEQDPIVVSHFVLNQIRETDFMGIGDENELLILLSNTKYDNSILLTERLNKVGISSIVLDDRESSQCLVSL